jgi:hypothetical protein
VSSYGEAASLPGVQLGSALPEGHRSWTPEQLQAYVLAQQLAMMHRGAGRSGWPATTTPQLPPGSSLGSSSRPSTASSFPPPTPYIDSISGSSVRQSSVGGNPFLGGGGAQKPPPKHAPPRANLFSVGNAFARVSACDKIETPACAQMIKIQPSEGRTRNGVVNGAGVWGGGGETSAPSADVGAQPPKEPPARVLQVPPRGQEAVAELTLWEGRPGMAGTAAGQRSRRAQAGQAGAGHDVGMYDIISGCRRSG